MTKREAAQQIAIVAAQIRLALDASDSDCPTWADDLDRIAEDLDYVAAVCAPARVAGDPE